MKIVADSNIWLGKSLQELNAHNSVPDQTLVVTFSNLFELAKSSKIKSKAEQIRLVLQFISTKHLPILDDPPFIYIKKLDDPEFIYDFKKDYGLILQILDYFERENEISDEIINEVDKHIKKVNTSIQSVSDFFNFEATKIRNSLLSVGQKADKYQTEEEAKEFISFYVDRETHGNGLSSNFDWNLISFFIKILTEYMKKLSTGAWVSSTNDWHDLFITTYIQPTSKFWTNEVKWVNMIHELKLQDYLYLQDNIT